jgi:Xaa-Pro aminopeptidase
MNNPDDSTLLLESEQRTKNGSGPVGLPASVYAERRAEFMRRLGTGAAIFRSAPSAVRSNDSDYKFRQDSDFHYLTGFDEPDSVCLLLPEHPEHKFVLFVRPRNPEREVWDGRRAGPEGAQQNFGADAAFSIEELNEKLLKYIEHAGLIHYRFGRDTEFDDKVFDLVKSYRFLRQRTGVGPYGILDPGEILHEMRLFKSTEELELMRRSARIAAGAHEAAMRAVQPGMYEFEIEAIIENHFRRNGANGPAYTSIVGSGLNATILHYHENTRQIGDNELLLVDAGAEYEYYCSDITRTYPATGKFTREQREIYEIVLEAQLQAIDRVRPGTPFIEVHQRALEVIVEGLLRLGLLEGEKEKVIEEATYRKFYMHRTSHWIGVDVHDVGKYQTGGESRKLEPGMILTVEPGIYIGDIADVPAEYRNIGVRIEDDVLVTEQGNEVLTSDAPKQIAELESIIGSSRSNR